MADYDREWAPVIAERERSSAAAEASFPCRGPYNRYLGCVGARKCRASGVSMCVLGRWPDEHPGGGRVDGAPASPLARQAAPVERRRAAPELPTPERAQTGSGRPLVGIVQQDRRLWQQLSRQVTGAGFDPVWFAEPAAACEALRGDSLPAALLVDPQMAHTFSDAETLADLATRQDVPLLKLPSVQREPAGIESAARMAVLWLAVTLRDKQAYQAS